MRQAGRKFPDRKVPDRDQPLGNHRMQDRYREIYDAFGWEVPERFNIAQACCRRHAQDHSRVALHWEDESGLASTHTFRDLQEQADRLSNALAGLGLERGDRVAIILPQRPETAIAHIACYQMGAVAMPLSVLFGPDALEYRLQDSEAVVVLVDPASLPNLVSIRDRLPHLEHVIGVAGASESDVLSWEELLAQGSPDFAPVDTSAADPALLIYTSGTTGPPKGALMPQRVLLGNVPGFVHSHDLYPKAGDFFWSPADWAWTGGLMDALLPSLYHGRPLLGYRGRFEPEKALWLMQKYGVRNAFLFPTALKMIMKAVPEPRKRYGLALRSIMSAGESVGDAVFNWCRDSLGVTVNEMFGQTEINYIVGNSHTLWPAKPGSIGRPYPGHRVACIDDAGNEVPQGEVGEVAAWSEGDPVFFLEYWNNPEATRKKYTGKWCRTGDLAKRDEDGDFWYQGRTDDMFKSAGYRIGPSEIENCLVKHPAVANAAVVGKPDAERGNIVKAFVVLSPGHRGSAALEAELQQHVRGKLAPYEYPKEIEFIDSLPMTTTGKVQRRVLRLREEERKKGQT
jgi:acetyl-CoA synthetase